MPVHSLAVDITIIRNYLQRTMGVLRHFNQRKQSLV